MKALCLLGMLSLARFAPAQARPCATVEGDHIFARDFTAVLPAFSSLPAETPIALAPGPGARRVFHPMDLLALAKRYSLAIDTSEDICFEWRMGELDRDRVLEAMRAALPFPNLKLEIVETSRYPIPPGRIEFRRESLGSPASTSGRTPVQWRGNVIYGKDQRFGVWARVLVSASMPRIVASGAIKRGDLIRADQLRVEAVEAFPAFGDLARTPDKVIGRAPLRDLADGAEIHLNQLTSPPDISRGEIVDVEVRSGATRLALTGKAESAGRNGERIAIRNLSSNRVFQARVSGKGKAVVEAGLIKEN